VIRGCDGALGARKPSGSPASPTASPAWATRASGAAATVAFSALSTRPARTPESTNTTRLSERVRGARFIANDAWLSQKLVFRLFLEPGGKFSIFSAMRA